MLRRARRSLVVCEVEEKLKEKFLPSDYEQKQYPKLTTLSQDTLSVHEYNMEFDKLCLVRDLEEEPIKIARYIKGSSDCNEGRGFHIQQLS